MDIGIGINIASAALNQWTPASLFSTGAQGAWLDPSDFSTLFQDVAGTVPVVADGDPVALMLDKSGNGNHAAQSVAAARPTWHTDGGGRPYIDFDGVDDILEAPFAVNHTFSTLSMGYQGTISGQNGGIIFGVGIGSTGRDYIYTSFGNTRAYRQPQTTGVISSYLAKMEVLQVSTLRVGPGVDYFLARANGVDVAWNGTGAAEMALTGAKIHLGARYPGSGHTPARFWGAFYITRALTDVELSQLEAFLANKSGVTL